MKNSTSSDHILHPSLQVMPSKFQTVANEIGPGVAIPYANIQGFGRYAHSPV